MASEVTIELLDRGEVMIVECQQDLTLEQLFVTMADICRIFSVARGDFCI